MQLFHSANHCFHRYADFPRELFLLRPLVWNKFMQGRINQANGYRQAIHGLKNADEITALKWKELFERPLPGFPTIGDDHFLNGELAVNALLRLLKIFEEHVLGAAKTDAFGAHFARA